MVARDRIELSTFRFSVGRSYQLSYLAFVRGDITVESEAAGPWWA